MFRHQTFCDLYNDTEYGYLNDDRDRVNEILQKYGNPSYHPKPNELTYRKENRSRPVDEFAPPRHYGMSRERPLGRREGYRTSPQPSFDIGSDRNRPKYVPAFEEHNFSRFNYGTPYVESLASPIVYRACCSKLPPDILEKLVMENNCVRIAGQDKPQQYHDAIAPREIALPYKRPASVTGVPSQQVLKRDSGIASGDGEGDVRNSRENCDEFRADDQIGDENASNSVEHTQKKCEEKVFEDNQMSDRQVVDVCPIHSPGAYTQEDCPIHSPGKSGAKERTPKMVNLSSRVTESKETVDSPNSQIFKAKCVIKPAMMSKCSFESTEGSNYKVAKWLENDTESLKPGSSSYTKQENKGKNNEEQLKILKDAPNKPADSNQQHTQQLKRCITSLLQHMEQKSLTGASENSSEVGIRVDANELIQNVVENRLQPLGSEVALNVTRSVTDALVTFDEEAVDPSLIALLRKLRTDWFRKVLKDIHKLQGIVQLVDSFSSAKLTKSRSKPTTET